MKKQFRAYFILLTLIFSIFSFANIMLFLPVRATYVEGYITLDTTWTLVESPFIISNETIVCSNATLTIEPGVEVRFGGFFNITIEGKLIAEGTEDKTIRFTSNELEPKAGGWGTLWFNSAQESLLSNCIIEYGLNGITVENGYVNIQESTVRYNSENGVAIFGGYVHVEDCEVLNNSVGGIFVSGGSQVYVLNNFVSGNGDGIILNGVLTSVSITQNEISFNQHSGILCEAETYGNTVIVNNTVSQNNYGFCVSSDAVTNITRNYILNNHVGIMYESGTGHIAHFNDITGNELGMDVSSGATVDATYNYWGNESGPYHPTLNPHGKGNPVGGDGINLDFIFFLTHPIDYSNAPPTAILWTDKVLVAPNQPVTFVGADSHDDGRINYYFYDFGDGKSSDWTTLSLFTYNYSSVGTYSVRLKVRDDFNVTSNIVSAQINVMNLPSLKVSITLSNYKVEYNDEVFVTAYVSYGTSAVENANVTFFSVKGGIFTPFSGLTNSSGYFTAVFKAPNVTEVTDVRIIARASKLSYTDGSAHDYLKVIPPLTVQMSADPPTLKSEETATITVQVLDSFEIPVSDVSLTLSAENGDLSATTGVTDANGMAIFSFTASQTLTQINSTILVIATKTGYGKGQGLCTIPIEPKVLFVEVTADPAIITSEGKMAVTVQVSYEGNPIAEANITLTSESGGNFIPAFVLSDEAGTATFTFTAPPVDEACNITLLAKATKEGYVDGENWLNIAVNPGIINVEIIVKSAIAPEESTLVSVHVTCNQTPVFNAAVTLSCTDGSIPITTNWTDADGYCTFVYIAPQTTTSLTVNITANATKYGYLSEEEQISITVSPEAKPSEGLPWMTMLLIILIPLIIAVVIIVLVKLKIIEISAGEEEGSE
ncbi:MAG: Ig-like domain-containing protein [Candidatus Bathyarchaeia archaeon]